MDYQDFQLRLKMLTLYNISMLSSVPSLDQQAISRNVTSLWLLHNTAFLVEKQQIQIL
jgi:hypothetical protein